MSIRKISLDPFVTEFVIEPDSNVTRDYYLRPGGLTDEQKFIMRPNTFTLKKEDSFTLQFGSLEIKITELSHSHMVAFRNGLERHYKKINGL